MIELKQVSFTYQGQEHNGLRDIDLTIADGSASCSAAEVGAARLPSQGW